MLRTLALAAALAAAGTTVALWVYTPTAPVPPGYTLRIAAPAPGAVVTSPVAVEVCGRIPNGSTATVPGSGRLISLSVDGQQVAENTESTVFLEIAPGAHRIGVEVLTTDHRRFSPPLSAETTVDVTGPGVASRPPSC